MKKLALFCGMAALGMSAMSARAAIPNGYESANITATLTVQESDEKTKAVSFNNKDMLTLLANEFDFQAGSQLAMHGLNTEEFAIIEPSGGIIDASETDDDYTFS